MERWTWSREETDNRKEAERKTKEPIGFGVGLVASEAPQNTRPAPRRNRKRTTGRESKQREDGGDRLWETSGHSLEFSPRNAEGQHQLQLRHGKTRLLHPSSPFLAKMFLERDSSLEHHCLTETSPAAGHKTREQREGESR